MGGEPRACESSQDSRKKNLTFCDTIAWTHPHSPKRWTPAPGPITEDHDSEKAAGAPTDLTTAALKADELFRPRRRAWNKPNTKTRVFGDYYNAPGVPE